MTAQIKISVIFSIYFLLSSIKCSLIYASPKLKILTYNIALGKNGINNSVLSDYIYTNNIDIVGIQEFYGGTTALEDLLNKLNSRGYPMFGRIAFRGRPNRVDKFYQIILSRYPITYYREYYFPLENITETERIILENPGEVLQEATIQIDGETLKLFNWHAMALTESCGTLKDKVFPILSNYKDVPHIIILGDFNLTYSTIKNGIVCMSDMIQNFTNVCENPKSASCGSDSGSTIVAYEGVIDYIFLGKGFPPALSDRTMSAYADIDIRLSDHFPVLSEMAISTLKGYQEPIVTETCSISGWVCDRNDYQNPLRVSIFEDGKKITDVVANISRESAVGERCGGSRQHGFFYSFQTGDLTGPGPFKINVRAQEIKTGNFVQTLYPLRLYGGNLLSGNCITESKFCYKSNSENICSEFTSIDHLLFLSREWGKNKSVADFDNSGTVNINDLIKVVQNWR